MQQIPVSRHSAVPVNAGNAEPQLTSVARARRTAVPGPAYCFIQIYDLIMCEQGGGAG